MELSDRIREHRKRCGLSQEKLAELCDVSRQAVTKWETGASAPSTEKLFRLAEIFGTTLELLVQGEGPETNLAQELFALQQAQKQADREGKKAFWKKNVRFCLGILGFYLAAFIAGKLFCLPLGEMTVWAWLFDSPPGVPSYLYEWLLDKGFFLGSALISALPALWGKHRFALATAVGFALGLPLGEWLGPNPAGAYRGNTHYGWAIWGGIFLASMAAGILWEGIKRRMEHPQHK